jgi:hypothetical protein
MDVSWADGGRPRKKKTPDSTLESTPNFEFRTHSNPQNQIHRILSSPSPSSCFLRQNFAGTSAPQRISALAALIWSL